MCYQYLMDFQYHEAGDLAVMVLSQRHGIKLRNALFHAMKNFFLDVLNSARQCSTKKQKSPQLRGLSCYFMLFGAGLYQTPNYSHSIVPGGFDVTS